MGTPEESTTSATETTQEVDWKAEFERAEKRRKDTQAAFTKSQQELKTTKAELGVLKTQAVISLSPDELSALEDLKFSDPEKWRLEVNKLEKAKVDNINTQIMEETKKLSFEEELIRRQSILVEFNQANPGLVIDDEVLQYDVPKRITSKLEKGEVSFEDFLAEVKEYLTTPKTVKTVGVEQQPNLGNVGGGSTASHSDKAVKSSYETEIF